MANLIKKINFDPFNYIANMEIDELEQAIKYSADKYYNSDISVVSDDIYDLMIDFLRQKNPKSKILKEVGAKVKSKNKVELDYWLGSMEKIKPQHISQFNSWINKYKPPYFLSDKLDGVSALLIYRKNGNINLYTRGTASEGLDITLLIKYLNLPTFDFVIDYVKSNNIKSNNKDNYIAFRGELIMESKTFNKKWLSTFKNGRNAVAGLVNSKKINPEFAIDVKLVLYEVIDPFYTMEKQFNIIHDLKFNIVHYKKVNTINFNILSEYLKDRRENSNYVIDGIIVSNNDLHKRNTDSNPEYAFAFKDILEDQSAETEIIDIEWNVSKNNYLIPTIILKPIKIGGVEIKRVTGNNAKFIVDNQLGKGAIVEIIRSGDVIPKIQKVIKSVKPGLPKSGWYWNETEVDIISSDSKTDDLKIKNIYFFFSKLNTKGLGEKIVENLYYAGFNTVEKILSATVEDFLKVDRFQEKTAINLVESIKKSTTNVNMAKLMAGTNKLGEGIGETRMKQVLDKYPNLLNDYKSWTKKEFMEKIMLLDGWNEKTSSVLVNNFHSFDTFYEKIKKYITLEEKKIKKSSDKSSKLFNKFDGLTMVMTGFRDNELQKKLEDLGVKFSSSVSKNTNYLVVKDQATIDEGTGKVQKAIEVGTKIITKNDLIKMINL